MRTLNFVVRIINTVERARVNSIICKHYELSPYQMESSYVLPITSMILLLFHIGFLTNKTFNSVFENRKNEEWRDLG